MKIQYLYFVILSVFIQYTLGQSVNIKYTKPDGSALKAKDIVNAGDNINAQIVCDATGPGELNILTYCSNCPSFNGIETARVGDPIPFDCSAGTTVSLPVPPDAQPSSAVFFAFYANFKELGFDNPVSPYMFIQQKGEFSTSKQSTVRQQFSDQFSNEKEKKVPWTDRAKNIFLIIVPVLILLALLFVVYQKSFKPKQQLHAKKSVCKYNFEKNPNTLKSLDSQGLRMTGRNEMGLQKRNSLTNLKTLQSKLKSPITETVNYESSKPITSRRGSTSSTCSSNLSFRLDASYLDVKLKDEDSDLEDNNIESDDEEKLMNNNHVAVNIDERRGRDDQRGRGMPQDARSKSRPRNDYRNMNGDNHSPTPPQRRNVRPNNASRERRNDSRSPMHSPNAPVAPSRLDSKPQMNSPSPNSHSPSNSMNNLNNRNMSNNGLVARNINNPNMNNQVSIDIHSPRTPNDKNHNASKGYVNSPSQVAAQRSNSQQAKSNKNDSGSEDTAEVIPNHPFNDKVYSVAYINVPENDDELELVIGDQIKFIEVYDDDWALALRIRDRKEGMVPLTCVKEYFTVLHKN